MIFVIILPLGVLNETIFHTEFSFRLYFILHLAVILAVGTIKTKMAYVSAFLFHTEITTNTI